MGSVLQLWNKFNGVMTGMFSSVSGGISGYVIPLAWIVLAIIMLYWCYLTMTGKTSTPVLSWLVPGISFMLVLYVMGGGYLNWIANPLWNLPNELLAATGKSSSTDPFEQVSTFWSKFGTLASAMGSLFIDNLSHAAIGSAVLVALILVVLIVSVAILVVAVFCGLLYARLGLTLVLAIGPFFVFLLVLQQTRDKFFSWLNTALFFVFYYVLCGLYMALFFRFVDDYINAVTGYAQSQLQNGPKSALDNIFEFVYNTLGNGDNEKMGNILVMYLPLGLISIIMAFMFLQLSTIAGSMTSGAGGAVGQGASSLFYYATGVASRSARALKGIGKGGSKG